MTELSPANVDLPVEMGISPLIYKFCYVFADDNDDGYLDRFHAGDMIYFYTNFTGIDNEVEYLVLAPIEGQVMYSQLINDRIGWEIRIRTPYVYEGEQVWYDIVHATEPVSGIHEGVYVQRGQPILVASTLHDNGRFEKVIDMGFRNGPRGANPDIQHSFSPYSYFSPAIFFEDDFQRMESADVSIIFEECSGDPVPPGYPMNP